MNALHRLAFLFGVMVAPVAHAQHDSIPKPGEWEQINGSPTQYESLRADHERQKKVNQNKQKASSVKDFFGKGHIKGHVRNYIMATANYKSLSDYYANGISGLIDYETANFKGFEIHLSGLFIFNLGSSDFTKTDPLTDGRARYELQLFDVQNPSNKHDLDRLDELYLSYEFHDSYVKLGRLGLYTPLMNMQDTRMKPYVVQGIWTQIEEIKHLKLNLGWFDHASPRSTVEWVSIAESIGVYAMGFNPDGSPSDYREHLESEGVAVAGMTTHFWKPLKLQVWNYWLENISNTAFLQADFRIHREEHDWLFGAQYLTQTVLNQGGNPDPSKRYMQPGQGSHLASFQVGFEKKDWVLTANYLRAFDNGRFVFPREWGREQFYTTVSRGRIEGMGDVQTLMFIFKHHVSGRLTYRIDLGQTNSPPVSDYRLNKYSNLSYQHFNFDIRYNFDQVLDGLNIRFLYTYKHSLDDFGEELAPYFYNANFHHFNLITNIVF